MMKVPSCRFCKSLVTFNMLNVKGCSEMVFFKSGLRKSLTICVFRNRVALTIVFFSKCLKIDADSRSGKKE